MNFMILLYSLFGKFIEKCNYRLLMVKVSYLLMNLLVLFIILILFPSILFGFIVGLPISLFFYEVIDV